MYSLYTFKCERWCVAYTPLSANVYVPVPGKSGYSLLHYDSSEQCNIVWINLYNSQSCNTLFKTPCISKFDRGTVILVKNYSYSYMAFRFYSFYFEVEVTLQLTVSHSVSYYVKVLSPLSDLLPDITFCPKVVFTKLLSCLCGAPSLTRVRVSTGIL
jgi:hypothetical protein